MMTDPKEEQRTLDAFKNETVPNFGNQSAQAATAAQQYATVPPQDTIATVADYARRFGKDAVSAMPDFGRMSALGDVEAWTHGHVPNPQERLLEVVEQLSANVQRLTDAIDALTAKLPGQDEPPTS